MRTLLIIDDEEIVRYSFRRAFESDEVRVLTARTAAEGLALAGENAPDVILLDLQLPDRSGLDVFSEIQALDQRRPIIFITAHGTTDTAIEAMKRGAFDYLIKPVDLERLSELLERAFEAARLMQVPALLPAEDRGDRIVGKSPVMQEMCKTIGRIAPQDVNVLILGESGTGKELVARAIYSHSKRAGKPFLAINTAAIPETLLESELFGHEKGAFTGADRRRIGKFEQCDGGTLLLDEIGDMPASLQAKMLRVLQEQRFERLGGNETIESRARILAATNQDLQALVAQGRFRADLYYRLNTITISVPPLRDRREDIPELASYFLFRFDRELGLDIRGIAPEALERLQEYPWPGNVRELQGAIKQAMLNASGHLLVPEFFPESLFREPPAESIPASPANGDNLDLPALVDRLIERADGRLHDEVIAAVERLVFPRVLRHTGGHQGKACEILGLNRSTLRHRLRVLGLIAEKSPAESSKSEEPGKK